MANVPLLRQSHLPDEYEYLLGKDAMGEINLLRAMVNNVPVMQSYMRYGTTLWRDGGLPEDDIERSILTIARALRAEYEWHQHVPIAREVGVPDPEIQSIADADFDRFGADRAALLGYVESVANGDADMATYEAFASTVDAETVVGVTLLVTHYVSTARFVEALDVTTEEEFPGWSPKSS